MNKILHTNKKGLHDFQIIEKFETGIKLLSGEVKSCRKKEISLQDSYIIIKNNEVWLINSFINNYKGQLICNTYDVKRDRKLLMHRKEVLYLKTQIENKHLTAIPINLYINDSQIIKLEIALVQGKHNYDKRESIKDREVNIEMQRRIKR